MRGGAKLEEGNSTPQTMTPATSKDDNHLRIGAFAT